jgi:hypothetical protein
MDLGHTFCEMVEAAIFPHVDGDDEAGLQKITIVV